MFSLRSFPLFSVNSKVAPRRCAPLGVAALLSFPLGACGADGAADPMTENTSPGATTPGPATVAPTPPNTPTSVTPPVTPNPPVAPNPPPGATTPSPVPAIPTTAVPNNPNPVPVPPPPPNTEGETSSEADSSGEDTASTSSSGETSAPPPTPGTGFHTEDGALYDVNGTEFVMRGVNYPYAWFSSQHDTAQQFQNIAATGANAVRVVLATGDQWTKTSGADLANIISWAKANKLVAILEPHDATGYGESTAAPHPEKMLDYWKSAEILNAIKGQEAYVLVNIANEPFGNNTSDEWESFHAMAVADLRAAGIKHTFVVDAPNWGQDWDNCMRDGKNGSQSMSCDAQVVYDADPDHNTAFSVHMYNIYGSEDIVRSYFDRFLSKGLPLIVGEFASDHGESGNVDEASIMALSEQHGVGYLGWSWSGNSDGLETLDITTLFNANSLTAWGERLINGENGLKQTGTPCTCFE